MTTVDMCLWHPACTPTPERTPCPSLIGPDSIPCTSQTEWIVRDWTQPGSPLLRSCTRCAAYTVTEIPLCGETECGAHGLDCTHPLPTELLLPAT